MSMPESPAAQKGGNRSHCVGCCASQRVVLLSVLTLLLIFVGVLNAVLIKVMYVAFKSDDGGGSNGSAGALTEWAVTAAAAAATTTRGGAAASNTTLADGSKFSFFVNQGVNLLYIIFGFFTVYPRLWCTNEITPLMRRCALHKEYAILASIDAFGTFFLCMGAVYVLRPRFRVARARVMASTPPRCRRRHRRRRRRNHSNGEVCAFTR
jgi:hypothetical protein